jgi:hypothetical protein
LIPQALTILIIGALFKEILSKISHFKCVAGSLALGMLREEKLGEEFRMEAMLAQCWGAKER